MDSPSPARVMSVVVAGACFACATTPKEADYVGNPRDMQDACTRAATVCPRGDDWIACHDDQWDCHRLGLWYEDGIKVAKDPAHARRIFESMCDRFEMASCQKLCEGGEQKRCVDLALLGIAGAGGRPFPPSYDARDRETFRKACRAGDTVACTMLELAYVPGSQRVVQWMNDCEDDHARCFAAACDESDPLGCALLCHVGEAAACAKLAEATRTGVGFKKPVPELASRLADVGATDTAYEFELHEQPLGAIPRAPKPPQRPVGEGLWSGWKTVHNVEGGAFGVTPVLTRTLGPAHQSTDVSGLVGFSSEIFMRSWYPADDKYLHFSLSGEIGGGTAGVDGRVAHVAMGGFRFPFTTTRENPYESGALYQSMSGTEKSDLDRAIFTHSPHALFTRGGYALRYSAVGPVISSAVELPRIELGYQYQGDDELLRAAELRTHAGLVLIGRFDVEDDVQPLGGALAWGGALVLHSRAIHTEVGAERIQGVVFGERPLVHRVDARGCVRLDGYLLCLEELFEVGSPGGEHAAAWQAGLFLGFDGLD